MVFIVPLSSGICSKCEIPPALVSRIKLRVLRGVRLATGLDAHYPTEEPNERTVEQAEVPVRPWRSGSLEAVSCSLRGGAIHGRTSAVESLKPPYNLIGPFLGHRPEFFSPANAGPSGVNEPFGFRFAQIIPGNGIAAPPPRVLHSCIHYQYNTETVGYCQQTK